MLFDNIGISLNGEYLKHQATAIYRKICTTGSLVFKDKNVLDNGMGWDGKRGMRIEMRAYIR